MTAGKQSARISSTAAPEPKPKTARPRQSTAIPAAETPVEEPWYRQLWFKEIVIAGLLSLALFGGQVIVDNGRSDREAAAANDLAADADRRENLRFVRERSSTDAVDRPFQGMELGAQNLAGLSLEDANFNGANLQNADFSDAKARRTQARSADFRNAILDYAQFGRSNFQEADLSGAHFYRAEFDEASLSGASLVGADLGAGSFRSASLTNADLTGAILWLEGLYDGPDFTGADLSRAVFTRTDLRDARLGGANLTDADLRGADLVGADLSASTVSDDVDLAWSCYDATTLWPANVAPQPSSSDRCFEYEPVKTT